MSSRRAVAWVVRSPDGEYWSECGGLYDWRVTRRRACRYDLDGARECAGNLGEGAKVWRVMRGKGECNFACNRAVREMVVAEKARDIARADLMRAEESKAAAWEQVRGLAAKAADAEAQLADAVRRMSDIISIAFSGVTGCPS